MRDNNRFRNEKRAENIEINPNVIAGRNSVRELLASGRTIDKVLVQKGERTGSITSLIAEARSRSIPVVECEKSKLDYISGRPNEATAHYNAPACDWCAMFVHLAAYRCGLGDKIPMLSYCDNQYYTVDGVQMDGYRSYYERRGQFLYASSYLLPEIGDLIIFDSTSAYDGKGDHIGIVINVDSYTGLIYTIEGNGRGDKVVYEQYPYFDSSIIGYCQTNLDSYSETVTPAPPVTPSQPAGPELPAIDMNNTSW
jgi:hypothetical protein